MNTSTKVKPQTTTRVETFVASAFAFAVTMLVISVDSIPSSFDEFLVAVKEIPAFAASFAIITWIWYEHAEWNKKFGLEDSKSVALSCLLVFIVLIYIYPLRLMMQGLFSFLSGGFLEFDLQFEAIWQVRFLFAFYAMGFFLLSITFVLLYKNGLAQTRDNPESTIDRNVETMELKSWFCTSLVCVLAFVLAVILPRQYIGFSGFTYFLLFPVQFLLRSKTGKEN